MTEREFSPREFLRSRRPERFSDSTVDETPTLDRAVLEHHLATLSSRSEEAAFERFARRLMQRTVCPNLVPQTGPSGGGDGKVDSETYPVAEGLALGWVVGTGSNAHTDRWAFAFSTQKTWRPKVRSDIRKLAGTERGYTNAFFVTNQYVPSKDRAKIQDELREECGLDVRIIDINWILSHVFENGLESLAIEHLGVQVTPRAARSVGPNDLRREELLAEAENRIAEMLSEGTPNSVVVDACLEAADLARRLELPRVEIDGRYERARNLAKRHGTGLQRLLAVYESAWTAYWWHEDYDAFAALYAEVEARAVSPRSAYALEKLANAHTCLYTAVRQGRLSEDDARLAERTEFLEAQLTRLSEDKERRTNALMARSLLMNSRLVRNLPDGGDEELRALLAVVGECEGLVGFPLDPLAEIVTNLGAILGDRPAYEELFEAIVSLTGKRAGEVRAARMLVTRGEQQLKAGRFYEAVRVLGRALSRLFTHESRHDLVRALYACSFAYEATGLHWAARGSLVTAASIANTDFWQYEEVTTQQAATHARMKWLEMRLGRVPHVLMWHEVDRMVRAALCQQGHDPEALFRNEQDFDAMLAVLLLRSEFEQLPQMTRLPDVLRGLDLEAAAVALLYALGLEEEVSDQLPPATDDDSRREFFVDWCRQPAAAKLSDRPVLLNGSTARLQTAILGCRVEVTADNVAPCVEVAESFLAALESLLATAINEGVMAQHSELIVTVGRAKDQDEGLVAHHLSEQAGGPRLTISCADFNPHDLDRESQQVVKDSLFEAMTSVLARVFMWRDLSSTLHTLFGDEKAIERSIHFTSSLVTFGNVHGYTPKGTLSAWTNGAPEYSLRRDGSWHQGVGLGSDAPEMGDVSAPDDSTPFDMESVPHSKMTTHSLIRVQTWDRAGWCGTAFPYGPAEMPPVVALLFEDAAAAAQIFEDWGERLGRRDEEDQLRLTILRGIDASNPHAYRVMIGSNLDAVTGGDGVAMMIARVNTMEPESSDNLLRFLDAYERRGFFVLTYGELADRRSEPRLFGAHVVMRTLTVKQAWEVGPNDPAVQAIRPSDEPVIPDDAEHVPFHDLLDRLREMERHSDDEQSDPSQFM